MPVDKLKPGIYILPRSDYEKRELESALLVSSIEEKDNVLHMTVFTYFDIETPISFQAGPADELKKGWVLLSPQEFQKLH